MDEKKITQLKHGWKKITQLKDGWITNLVCCVREAKLCASVPTAAARYNEGHLKKLFQKVCFWSAQKI